MKLLIRRIFNIVIGAISDDLETTPWDQTDYLRAGSTLKALLDVWGKDGLADPDSSTVRLRSTSRFNHSYRSLPSFSAHLWKKGCRELCIVDLLWCPHTWDCFPNSRETPTGTRFSMSSPPSPPEKRWIGWTSLTARMHHNTLNLLKIPKNSSSRQSPRCYRMEQVT